MAEKNQVGEKAIHSDLRINPSGIKEGLHEDITFEYKIQMHTADSYFKLPYGSHILILYIRNIQENILKRK